MKKTLYISAFILQFYFAHTQNLVPNPSFETYTKCPTTNSNIGDAKYWFNVGGTPDYFNGCASASLGLNVPYTQAGFQNARTGTGMVGVGTWVNPSNNPANINYREIIETQLITPLQIGTLYYMTFYINYSGYPPTGNWRRIAANKIGLRFSTVSSSTVSAAPINNFAHLYTNTIYKDTATWVKISGSFNADSVYKYVAIGNFFTDNNTDTSSYPGPGFGNMGAYYFIDDVSVCTNSLCTVTNTTVVESFERNSLFNIYPNPAWNHLFIENFSEQTKCEVTIGNSIGSTIKYSLSKVHEQIDVSDLESGIYMVKIKTENLIENKKLIIYKP